MVECASSSNTFAYAIDRKVEKVQNTYMVDNAATPRAGRLPGSVLGILVMQHLDIGPTPAAESCAQVGSDTYAAASRIECRVFVRMLTRLFAVPGDVNARFQARCHSHDFGSYRSVAVAYGSNERDAEFAFRVEDEVPECWDDIARYELAWFEKRAGLDSAALRGALASEDVPELLCDSVPPDLPIGPSFAELLASYPL